MRRIDIKVGALKEVFGAFRPLRHAHFWTLVLGAAIFPALASPSQAGIIITMSETGLVGPTVVVSTGANSAVFSGSFGDYTVSINTAVANSPGAGGLAMLNVSSTEIAGALAAGSSGILTINVEATGFTTPDATSSFLFMQSIGSNSSSSPSTMTFQSFLDGSGAPLQGPLAQGVSNTSVTAFSGPLGTIPFNISNTTTIQVAAGLEAATSGSTEIASSRDFVNTPEPSSTAMVMGCLIAVCGLRASKLRRRLGAMMGKCQVG